MEMEIELFFSPGALTTALVLVVIILVAMLTTVEIKESGDFESWGTLSQSPHWKLVLPPNCLRKVFRQKYFARTTTLVKRLKKILNSKPVDILRGFSFYPELLPIDCSPLLCFINCKSGGNQGKDLLQLLRTILNPDQVFDINIVDPKLTIQRYLVYPSLRVLVAGGDGTAGWILQIVSELDEHLRPPVMVFPLGTGNDLARYLGWGGTIDLGTVPRLLEEVQYADIAAVDRWEVAIHTAGKLPDVRRLYFNNYFGIGVDAQIALNFHRARQAAPHRFISQLGNKLWYGIIGGREILTRHCAGLSKGLTIGTHGEDSLDLGPDLEGIIFSNIPSYGGGAKLWADDCDGNDRSVSAGGIGDLVASDEKKEHSHGLASSHKYAPESPQDGLLEVVTVTGSLQLAQLQLGLSTCDKLTQGENFMVRVRRTIPMQIDGEPWMQEPCLVEIRRCSQARVLKRASLSDSHAGIGTDVIEWAFRKTIINGEQKSAMLKEYSSRVESRNIRRFRSQSTDDVHPALQ